MKYTSEIIVNKPIEEVVAKFDNPEYMKEWMEGLVSFETFEGITGQVGAKSKLLFKMGNKDMVMIETIVERNLPMEFSGTYEADGVWNFVSNKFEKIDDNTTKYSTFNEFKFTSPMMKVMGFLMPFMFKKQSMKYLEAFKKFVER